jgi:hypothetical protein
MSPWRARSCTLMHGRALTAARPPMPRCATASAHGPGRPRATADAQCTATPVKGPARRFGRIGALSVGCLSSPGMALSRRMKPWSIPNASHPRGFKGGAFITSQSTLVTHEPKILSGYSFRATSRNNGNDFLAGHPQVPPYARCPEWPDNQKIRCPWLMGGTEEGERVPEARAVKGLGSLERLRRGCRATREQPAEVGQTTGAVP